MRTTAMKTLRGFERLFLFLGLSLLLAFAVARVYRAVLSRAELHRFWGAREAASRVPAEILQQQDTGVPDVHLWSRQRVAAYRRALDTLTPPPLAVLKISAIHLEVPVLEGSDEFTLDRAVGHIEGTAAPGEEGNVGIAGHRDGFFRGLKDLRVGDDIDLVTQAKDDHYVVDEILIVLPEQVSVLRPREKSSLTLVTCYPFYFVGSAPKRFIVHASKLGSGRSP